MAASIAPRAAKVRTTDAHSPPSPAVIYARLPAATDVAGMQSQ
jgi:hypothetical protein